MWSRFETTTVHLHWCRADPPNPWPVQAASHGGDPPERGYITFLLFSRIFLSVSIYLSLSILDHSVCFLLLFLYLQYETSHVGYYLCVSLFLRLWWVISYTLKLLQILIRVEINSPFDSMYCVRRVSRPERMFRLYIPLQIVMIPFV